MKIKLNPKRSRLGITIWLVIVVLVLALIIIGTFAYLCLKTIHKIVPAPPPDQDGQSYIIGDKYGGGVITGYTNGPGAPWVDSTNYGSLPSVTSPTNLTVYIFAADRVDVARWTNCIWTGSWSDFTNLNTNGIYGLPVEQWPDGEQPAQRFYNYSIQTNQ